MADQNIHEHMAEKAELAAIYAEDGAFRTAADILERLAISLRDHADNCDDAMFSHGSHGNQL